MNDLPWLKTARAAQLAGDDGALRPTVFAEMTAIAAETGAVNLGQGFPDFDGPPEILEAARQAIADGVNQYGPGRGNPILIDAVRDQRRRHYGLEHARDEVLITVGATEAISAALLAYCDTGDEVIAFEPYYDEYAAVAALAGAKLVPVALQVGDFQPDPADLERAITPRTNAIVLNSPHNPTGAVFTPERLRAIAEIANRHGILVISDEVYEHLTFGPRHVPIAALGLDPDLSIAISSGGKTFSVTGCEGRMGGLDSPAHQRDHCGQAVHVIPSAVFRLQPAIPLGLGLPDAFFDTLRAQFTAKRDRLVEGLEATGMRVFTPESGYFALADVAPLGHASATELAYALPREAGVAAVPVSPFARPGRDDLRSIMRFAFCKRDETIAEASKRLQEFAARAAQS